MHSASEKNKMVKVNSILVEDCPTCKGKGTVEVFNENKTRSIEVECEDCDGYGMK